VTITAPTAGATVKANAKITATATDTQSTISQVRFYVDGALLGTDLDAPYSLPWNTKKFTVGSHTLTAVALDAPGNTGTSPAVTVTVTR
jgi:hypothetical protein